MIQTAPQQLFNLLVIFWIIYHSLKHWAEKKGYEEAHKSHKP